MALNIKPLGDRVIIAPAPAEEKTIGGIIIPDTAKEKPLQGTVLAVGNGTKDEDTTDCFFFSRSRGNYYAVSQRFNV